MCGVFVYGLVLPRLSGVKHFLSTVARRSRARRPVLSDFARRAKTAQVLERRSPDLRPGQGGDQKKKREQRQPETCHAMQILEEDPAAGAQARVKHAREAHAARWPPQVKTGQNHHNGPGGGRLHHYGPGVAEQQFAVEIVDDVREAVFFSLY